MGVFGETPNTTRQRRVLPITASFRLRIAPSPERGAMLRAPNEFSARFFFSAFSVRHKLSRFF